MNQETIHEKTPYWMSSNADMTKKHTLDIFRNCWNNSEFKKHESDHDESISACKRVVLTKDDLQQRHEEGLCFSYNKNFGPGHRCKKTLQIIMVVENNGQLEPEEEKPDDEKDSPDQLVEGELLVAQVSLGTLMRFTY